MGLHNKIAGFKMTRPEIVADYAAAGSIATFLGLSLTEWEVVVHLVAGVVAIVAGVAAATFHIIRTIQLEKKG